MAMLIEGHGRSYATIEKPFIDYFNRLHEAGYSKSYIKNILPQLDVYYNDLVVAKLTEPDFFGRYTIHYIFKIWKYNNFL